MTEEPKHVLPYNLDAECAVLGAVLYNNDALPDLPADAFHEPVHGRMWEAMTGLIREGRRVDPLLLDEKLGRDPALHQLGGLGFLANLVDHAPPAFALGEYTSLILDLSLRRKLILLTEEVAGRDTPADETLAFLESRAAELGRLTTGAAGQPVGLTALANMEAAFEGRFRGQATGLGCLDRVTGGLQPDDVWIFGGRTSMGKSIILPGLGNGLAQQGRGVLMFSLEMSERAVQARIAADIAYDRDLTSYGDDPGNIQFSDILRGNGTQAQRERARGAARKMASLPMVVVDKGGLSLGQIISIGRRQVRAWERQGVEPGAVIIDHIGLVTSSIQRDSKAAERADVVDRLKEASKQIGAPIIAAAQVNRGPEARNDKRPTMGDLNWSGSIEQIADMVCLLYRDSYYLERSGNPDDEMQAAAKEHELELIIPKNRSGPTCTVKAFIDVPCSAIRDVEDRYPADYRGRA